jgi:hypothetical protein
VPKAAAPRPLAPAAISIDIVAASAKECIHSSNAATTNRYILSHMYIPRIRVTVVYTATYYFSGISMGCINDSPLYIYTMAAALNLLPWLLVNLDPRSGILSALMAIDLGIVGSAFITSSVPYLNMGNIASSLPIMFALSSLIYLMAQAMAGMLLVFGFVGALGSAVVIDKASVKTLIENTLGITIGDVGFYCIVGAIILIIFFAYYGATSSVWIMRIVETLLYSVLATIAIKWLYEAEANNFIVCCYLNTDAQPQNMYTCPIYLWWWWLCVAAGMVAARAMLVFWYMQWQKKKFNNKYIEKKKLLRRYAGLGLDPESIKLLY